MNTVDIVTYAAAVLALSGLALALFKSDRLSVRLGALVAFGVFFVAMVLWAPVDGIWGNLAIGGVVLIAVGSRMKKPDAPVQAADVDLAGRNGDSGRVDSRGSGGGGPS